jgi:hypothetical protein
VRNSRKVGWGWLVLTLVFFLVTMYALDFLDKILTQDQFGETVDIEERGQI